MQWASGNLGVGGCWQDRTRSEEDEVVDLSGPERVLLRK